MSALQFIRLVVRHLQLILGIPLIMAFITFLLTQNQKSKYSSHSVINTGLVSGYNLERQNSNKADYTFTTNEIENLINIATAYETIEELSARLLAEYTHHEKLDDHEISLDGLKMLYGFISEDLKLLIKRKNVNDTFIRIIELRDSDRENPVYEILYSDNEFFGIEKLSTLIVEREKKSDMIRIRYTGADPGVTKRTIELLTEIFVRKHQEIKDGQSSSVLDFFEISTNIASNKLKMAEDELLKFRVSHDIINYYEQTRFISSKKEDLEELYQTELMKKAATNSSLKKLEFQMKNRKELSQLNDAIVSKRTRLAEITTILTKYELFRPDDDPKKKNIENLKEEASFLKNEIRKKAYDTFTLQVTPGGLEMRNVLEKWLSNIILLEVTKARLEVITQRRIEFEKIYNKFAPLGSKLKRIEREINVAEQEFLENLHSLNQARLHKHSLLMSTNLKVVDKPFYPTKPIPTKRIMFVAMSLMSGFLIVLASLIMIEYFDNTLKSVEKAQEITGLKVLGHLPYFKNDFQGSQKDLEIVFDRSLSKLLQCIKSVLWKKRINEENIVISLLSNTEKEGKSFIGEQLYYLLLKLGKKPLLLRPEPNNSGSNEGDPLIVHYPLGNNFMELESINKLIGKRNKSISEFDFVIVEYPALIQQQYPIKLLSKADINILISRASRVWTSSDRYIVDELRAILEENIFIVLNAGEIDEVENFIGETPKDRSYLRKRIKQIITMGFKSRLSLR